MAKPPKSPKKTSAPPTVLVLASTSPRRIEMVKQLKYQVKVIGPEADETPRKGEAPRSLVKRLARDKARSVMIRARATRAIVLAADTIVVSPEGKILNKPRDAAEAKRMLKSLGGRTHVVHTGYCLIGTEPGAETELVRVVTTQVTMRALSSRQIDAYVETQEPMDKAGAYGAQGIGMGLIDTIKGSYSNVIGLPLSQVLQDLEEHFE
jgi:septum formation protein